MLLIRPARVPAVPKAEDNKLSFDLELVTGHQAVQRLALTPGSRSNGWKTQGGLNHFQLHVGNLLELHANRK